MPAAPTSVRLDEATRKQIDELEGGLSEVIRRAVEQLHRSEATGILWQGSGLWQGWSLSTAHSASSYGVPVLVTPGGEALGPGDLARTR